MTSSHTTALGQMTINNEQLRKENDVLKTDITQLRTSNDAMKDEIGQLKIKIDIMKAENNQLKIENDDMKGRVDTSKSQPSSGTKCKLKVSQ